MSEKLSPSPSPQASLSDNELSVNEDGYKLSVNEFEDDKDTPSLSGTSSVGTPVAIVGRLADPTEKENWEDDFDLDDELSDDSSRKEKKEGDDDERDKESTPLLHIDSLPHKRREVFSPVDKLGEGMPLGENRRKPSISMQTNQFRPVDEEEEEEDWDLEIEEELGRKDSIDSKHKTTEKPHNLDDEAESSEESDWDKDFEEPSGQERKIRSDLLKNMLDSGDEDEEEEDEVIPNRFRLSKLIANKEGKEKFQIVMYPAPSKLYSMKLSSGLQSFSERDLEQWLETLTVKRKNAFFDFEGLPDWVGNEFEHFREEPEFSMDKEGNLRPRDLPKILCKCLLRLRKVYRHRHMASTKVAWEILGAIVDHLKWELSVHKDIHEDATPVKSKRYMKRELSFKQILAEGSGLLNVEDELNKEEVEETLKAAGGSENKEEKSNSEGNKRDGFPFFYNNSYLFELLYNVLFSVSKLLSGSVFKKFNEAMRTFKKFCPMFSPLFELLEVEAIAHNDGSKANICIRKFCSIYFEYSSEIGKDSEEMDEIYIKVSARSLCSLHLYLNNFSPLNISLLANRAQWDIEDDEFEWLDLAIGGEMPKDNNSPLEKLTWELCGNVEKRIKIIENIYEKIPDFSYEKARAAFTLGRFMYDLRNVDTTREKDLIREAESLIFECLFILDGMKPPVPNAVPVLTELGINALSLFGDVLLLCDKYKYAIVAFECALNAFRYIKNSAFHALIRRLSDICTANEDWKRSIKYYEAIREKSKHDGDLNMYYFIIQQISKVHVARGNFRKAEETIRHSLKFLKKSSREAQHLTGESLKGLSRSTPKFSGRLKVRSRANKFSSTPASEFRNGIFNLYISLARLYLHGDRANEAINVLEPLKKTDIPRGKSLVPLLLATAYVKKRQFTKAKHLLTEIEEMAGGNSSKKFLASKNRKHRGKSFGTLPPMLHATFADLVSSPEFMEISAKCFLYSGDYDRALFWVDKALTECPGSNLTHLARFYYRKGKILQSTVISEMMNSLPLFPDDEVEVKGLNEYFSNMGGVEMPSLEDNTPMPYLPDPTECIKAFSDAFEYFKKLDDNVRMAKSVLRIAETLLHMAFVSVAVLGHSYVNLIPWIQKCGFKDGNDEEVYEKFLQRIEDYAFLALEVSADTLHPMLLLKCYVTVAEVRFLKERFESSLSFWKEAKDTFFTLFMNGPQTVLVIKSTPGFTANLKSFFKRIVRLMMCFEPKVINQHLPVLDAYILYEVDLFSDLLASYSSDTHPPGPATEQIHGSPSGRVRRSEHWKSELTSAFGAAGSRANSRGLLRSSLMSSRLPDDINLQNQGLSLADGVCFGLYQINKACDQFSVGKLTISEMKFRNGSILNKMIKDIQLLRTICGYEKVEISKRGSITSINATSSVSSTKKKHGRNVSMWLMSGKTVGDPLWGNLTYILPLDNVTIIYSPVAEVKAVRLVSETNFSFETLTELTKKRDLTDGSTYSDHASNGSEPDSMHSLNSDNNISSKADSWMQASTPSGVSSIEVFRTPSKNSLVESKDSSNSNNLAVRSAERRKNLLSFGSDNTEELGDVTLYSANSHLIPSPAFLLEFLEYFREKADPILEYMLAHNAPPPAMRDPTLPNGLLGIDPRLIRAASSGESVSRKPAGVRVGTLNKLKLTAADSDDDNDDDDNDNDEPKPRRKNGGLENFNEDTDDEKWSISFNGPISPQTMVVTDVTELRRRIREKSVLQSAMGILIPDQADQASDVGSFIDNEPNMEFNPNEHCSQCSCKWLSCHYWDAPNCRNCYHDHSKAKASLNVEEDGKGSANRAVSPPPPVGKVGEQFGVPPSHSSQNAKVQNLPPKLPRPLSMEEEMLKSNKVLVPRSVPPSDTPSLSLRAADSLLPPALNLHLVKEMFSSLDPQNILTLFAAIFGECRIIFSASSHYRIKAVINSLLRLMYPFQWQHMFIPVLSRESIAVLEDTHPYIIGINSWMLECFEPPEGVVIAHLDKNFVKYSPGSFINFPIRYKKRLSTVVMKFMTNMFKKQLMQQRDYKEEQGPFQSRTQTLYAFQFMRSETIEKDDKEDKDQHHRDEYEDLDEQEIKIKLDFVDEKNEEQNLNTNNSEKSKHSKSKMLNLSTSDDVEDLESASHLRALRDGFLSVFISLFYKYRLFWNSDAAEPFDKESFLDYTKQECQPFIQSFVRTLSFKAFINVRASMRADKLGYYLFDNLVERRLEEKLQKFEELRNQTESGDILFSHGNRSFNKRHIILDGRTLRIYKGRNSNKPKHMRVLSPGEYRVVVPVVELTPSYFSFEICDVNKPPKMESFYFRSTSLKQRKYWVKHIEARVMSPELQKRYEIAVQFLKYHKIDWNFSNPRKIRKY